VDLLSGGQEMIELSVFVVQWEDRCRVYLRGELDLSTAWRLWSNLETTWGTMEFDCSELMFLDCSGLSVFIECRNRGQAVVLTNLSPSIEKLIEICGLRELFELRAEILTCAWEWGDLPG
jgi:anti-anti-sigma factor